MKWVNHKISTFSIMMILTQGSLIPSVLAAIGSITPDLLEGKKYESHKWRKKHRKISHWLLGYIITLFVIATLFYTLTKTSITTTTIPQIVSLIKTLNSQTVICIALYVAFYITAGCIFHVLQDSLSAPVPFISPTKRNLSLAIIKTGSIFEYILSFGLLFLSLILI